MKRAINPPRMWQRDSRPEQPGHPEGYEQWKPGDKKRDVLTINGDMFVMGHDRGEAKGRVKKTLRKKEAGIPGRNMCNRFMQQGDRKGEFFKGKYSAKAA